MIALSLVNVKHHLSHYLHHVKAINTRANIAAALQPATTAKRKERIQHFYIVNNSSCNFKSDSEKSRLAYQ